jgi:hypothetical protein
LKQLQQREIGKNFEYRSSNFFFHGWHPKTRARARAYCAEIPKP